MGLIAGELAAKEPNADQFIKRCMGNAAEGGRTMSITLPLRPRKWHVGVLK
jgi:hypothetical protein